MVDLAYVIAGSEATGGAGLQVDLKTFQALDVYGVATTTCIVSFDPKNNWGHRFVPIAPDVIADQIEAATAAHDLDVVKIGMLGTPATIEGCGRGPASAVLAPRRPRPGPDLQGPGARRGSRY